MNLSLLTLAIIIGGIMLIRQAKTFRGRLTVALVALVLLGLASASS